MTISIQLKLNASLRRFAPPASDHYPIEKGLTIRRLIARLGISSEEVKLIFIDNAKASLDSVLGGGERVAIFPPIGGG